MFTHLEHIKTALASALPGVEAQRKMAPKYRLPQNGHPSLIAPRPSSVFVLLYRKNNEWHIPLIQRPSYVGYHSAQIGLPGGKKELSDITMLDTAYRETEEEIGIHKSIISYLGSLTPIYIPKSNFMVHPFLGIIEGTPNFICDPHEVSHLIEAPLDAFFNADTIQFLLEGDDSMPNETPYYNIEQKRVWGATAMIISELTEILKFINLK